MNQYLHKQRFSISKSSIYKFRPNIIPNQQVWTQKFKISQPSHSY